MDIPRGSRRARQVANAANTSAGPGAPASSNDEAALSRAARQQQGRQRVQGQLQSVTPRGDGPQHQTPEQEAGERQARAPPPNPFRLHRTNPGIQPRLSMPLDSDESSSEPEISALEVIRNRGANAFHQRLAAATTTDDYDTTDGDDHDDHQEVFGETEVTSVESMDEDAEEAEEVVEQAPPLPDPTTLGLKEISNLGKFTVSSHKQGNGVEELRSDDLKQYWQSDGPQPHKLTVYFVKRVGIREIRFYVDYNDDESYTPTKIIFKSGTSENNLIEFATMELASPVGWQRVPLEGAGGDPDGNTLVSWVLQVQVLENHQNGKDTHLRGIKIYAFDGELGAAADRTEKHFAPTRAARRMRDADRMGREEKDDTEDDGTFSDDAETEGHGGLSETARLLAATRLDHPSGGFSIPEYLKEPEIR